MSFLRPLAAGLALLVAATVPSVVHAQKAVDFLQVSKGWGRVAADFDGDGHQDVFVTGHDSDDRIFYWTPTGYLPGPHVFPWLDRHACAAADVNRDGRLDLFCAIGGELGTSTSKANELWLQQANGVFAKVSNHGAEDPSGRGRIPVLLDVDHDGWPDLYLTNESTPRADGLPNWNHLYLNRRDNTFAEIPSTASGSAALGLSPGFECAAKGDIDGDGWDDLLVCEHKAPGHLYVNNHANDFARLSNAATAAAWKDATLVDVDADGRDDLVVLTESDHLQIWLNTGVAPYYMRAALDAVLPAPGRSLAVGRFNRGPRQDVYVVLSQTGCADAGVDTEPDVVFMSTTTGGWQMQRLVQSFTGCGNVAATVDGTKVLLENGTPGLNGPHFVLTF